MRKIAIFIVVVSLLLLCAAPALASGVPKLPHAFYGIVKINDNPALDGTRVSATVNIGDIISTQNPVTTEGGSYGIKSLYLLVQGYDIPPDATITFHVTNENGTAIGGTDTFLAGGGPDEMNLSVYIAVPPPPTGGGGVWPTGAPPTYVETNLFGAEAEFSIDSETGEILKAIEATSADGMLTITIPEGTIALDKDGDPLETLEVSIVESPPDPPDETVDGKKIIGLPYDFEPAGAIFTPPFTLEWNYDPGDIPEGWEAEDLVIAYYDEDTSEWLEVDWSFGINTYTNTVTASVSHFTTFAIIARAAAPLLPPEEEVVPPEVKVVPPPEEEIVPPPPVAPPEEEEVVPVVPVKPPINWPLIGAIIVGVVLAGLLIFFLVVRRRAV